MKLFFCLWVILKQLKLFNLIINLTITFNSFLKLTTMTTFIFNNNQLSASKTNITHNTSEMILR